ncbi:MAG: hypothetical protein DRP16_00530 [Candidatus Aenigmatarchaeota archaeon]|nr:MAG: hypothetical protein DRP16_00530 [Candidatus Aenigmarchaeota archaeon]
MEKVIIFADKRENSSQVVRHLKELAEVKEKKLELADYIVSDRVAVERKTIRDFLQSIIDHRLFKQADSLISAYERPVLILEGNPELLFLERNMHSNTIRGVFSSLALDYSLPTLWTQNSKETALQIYWLAKREQIENKREIQIRAKQKTLTESGLQEYIVAGLPSVSNVLSQRLLKKFKTVRKIFTAKPEKLMKVDGVGRKKAERIWEILNKRYED